MPTQPYQAWLQNKMLGSSEGLTVMFLRIWTFAFVGTVKTAINTFYKTRPLIAMQHQGSYDTIQDDDLNTHTPAPINSARNR